MTNSRVQTTCKCCKNKYIVFKSFFSKSKFCSRKCKDTFKKQKRKIFKCLYCKKEFFEKFSSANKFCNSKCCGLYRKELNTTEKVLLGKSNNNKKIREYLLKTRGQNCEVCLCPSAHNGKPLVLQVHHKDGNSDNNKLKNIQLLCPNCHSQTDTFCTRNKKYASRNLYNRQYRTKRLTVY